MAVRTLLGSRAAVGCTALGAAAVSVVFAIGWPLVGLLRVATVDAHPLFLGGLGELLYLVGLGVLAGLLAVVWYPFGAGVAYAVGRETRGESATLGQTLQAVRNSDRALYRWLKTRIAVAPLAERILAEEDVAPTEVMSGCEAFVVPALVVDAPGTLPRAVERANRMTPQSGRQRVLLGAAGPMAVIVVLGGVGGYLVVGPATVTLAALLAVLGGVLTGAVDAAWRAETYASADLSDGFSN